jgi:pyridinium-3,5-biscarboxylic acid mononucleotide synthase
VTSHEARLLLQRLRDGGATVESVLADFQHAPVAELEFATVDTQRGLRKGCPEVIYAAGKTPAQVVAIARKLLSAEGRVLITRCTREHASALKRKFRNAAHHETARCVTIEKRPHSQMPGAVAVVAAGTSDLPVAEEAAVTAEFMGCTVTRITDVGVAGLHRLLRRVSEIRAASVVVAVAGMEAALPSVIGGLIDKPLIGVPTSVGYGTHFGGVTALLGMLNSCATGMTVVNIDNGFGAGYAAARIVALAATGGEEDQSSKAKAQGKRQTASSNQRAGKR